MGRLMNCQAQEGARRAPSRPPAQPPAQELDTPGVTSALADVSEDYLISPGDVIDIQVDRAPELSGVRRVSASGTIRMVYLGSIKAQGVTADELASFIRSEERRVGKEGRARGGLGHWKKKRIRRRRRHS